MTVSTTIGGLLGKEGFDVPVIDTSGITLLGGIPLGKLLTPLTDILTGLLTDLVGPLTTAVTDPDTGVLAGLRAALAATVAEDTDWPWAHGAAPSDWTLTASSDAQSPTGATGSAEVTDVPVAPGTYTLGSALTGATSTDGLPAEAYRTSGWTCSAVAPDGTATDVPLDGTRAASPAVVLATAPASTTSGDGLTHVTCTAAQELVTADVTWTKTAAGAIALAAAPALAAPSADPSPGRWTPARRSPSPSTR